MYIDKKYIRINTDNTIFEYPPMLYFDILKIKPDNFNKNKALYISLGVFKFHVFIEIMWGFEK